MYSDSTERSFAGALVFFLVMALSAYVLLVTALVFWLEIGRASCRERV